MRCYCRQVRDVPITFRDREAGESKLSGKQNVEYVLQLLQLYWFAFRGLIVFLVVAALAAVGALARAYL